MTIEEKQYNKMVNTPIRKLVISLAIPTIISMLVTALYNMADTYFVAQIDTCASAAVGVVFPFQAIIQAIGFTFGMGGGSVISAYLGQRKDKEAQITGSCAFYGAIFLGLLITLFGLLFLDKFLVLLGASEAVLPYARDYGLYITIGAAVMTGSFVLNNLLRAEGKAKLAMIGLTTGGILNIFLDPLFITVFDLGIAGAAIATVISQMISFGILFFMFISKRSIITLNPKYISLKLAPYSEIVKVGMPSFFRQGLASLATILMNRQAGLYGDEALAAISIVSKVFMMIFSVCLGIGQGYQPVCGYNYFAKRYDRVKKAMFFTLECSAILLTVVCLVCFIFSREVMMIFRKDDALVIDIGAKALKYQCFALPFLSLNVICNMTFQSTKKKFKATLLSACRQGIFFIPLVFLLPYLTEVLGMGGLLGVELTQACADFLTFMFSIPFFFGIIKHFNSKEKEQNNIVENNTELEF